MILVGADAITDTRSCAAALTALVMQTEPDRARRLLARALVIGDGTESLDALLKVQPDAALAIAADYTAQAPKRQSGAI